eukprot:TRINITY_DN8284_c0_g1_i1.p1 TRINITY_DN8284_c0_g1~~TRINITY_DN8284_c0_g1_i1.p1  ORF type:complete len:818 (-),score=205.70 TRINITY_DN8284_c0_g1_i1:106-2559(-)
MEKSDSKLRQGHKSSRSIDVIDSILEKEIEADRAFLMQHQRNFQINPVTSDSKRVKAVASNPVGYGSAPTESLMLKAPKSLFGKSPPDLSIKKVASNPVTSERRGSDDSGTFSVFSGMFMLGGSEFDKAVKKEKKESEKKEKKERKEREDREKKEWKIRKKEVKNKIKHGRQLSKPDITILDELLEDNWLSIKNPEKGESPPKGPPPPPKAPAPPNSKLSNSSKLSLVAAPVKSPTASPVEFGKSKTDTQKKSDFPEIGMSRSYEDPPSLLMHMSQKRNALTASQHLIHEAEDVFDKPMQHHYLSDSLVKEENAMDTAPRVKLLSMTGFRDEDRYPSTISDDFMVSQNITWQNVTIPESKEQCALLLKYLIRKGIPDHLRPQIWQTITGCNELLDKNPRYYLDLRQSVFGDKLPKYILKVPTFGGAFDTKYHYLNEHGIDSTKRILCVLAMDNPGIDYFPVIPDLVCILLHFMGESETYATTSLMIQNRDPKREFFKPGKKGITLLLHTFDDLLDKHATKIYAHMKALDLNAHHFADDWFLRLFITKFPFPTVLRIFDAFLNEGSKVLYRVALAFMKLNKQILLKCNTATGFIETIDELSSQCTYGDALMKKAFAIRMRSKYVQQLYKKNTPKLLAVVEPKFPVYYRPKVEFPSDIIADEDFEQLWSWLPHKYCIKDPVLIYTSKKQGFSLKHFFNTVADEYPSILIVKTNKNEIFGAFVSSPWEPNKGYFGDRDCFLWKFTPEPKVFRWGEGNPPYMMLVNQNGIQVGAGRGVGFQLDKEFLNGRTERCETFQNEPLTKDGRPEFECVAIELFGFK